MSRTLTAALIQLNAGLDPARNADALIAGLETAAAGGAQLALSPEMTNIVDGKRDRLLPKLFEEDADPTLAAARAAARRLNLWTLIGSLAIKTDKGVANRSFLIGADGEVKASYDKIHLFDVDLPNGERYRESATYAPGAAARAVNTPWGKLGLAICYDLRFPHLFRALAKAGADILTVPAAFTKVTGEAHWHTLLRARAIETGCFVLAPAQTGVHEDGRATFGHSLAVDPWGKVVADGGLEPGVTMAMLELDAVSEARGRIPALQHDREYEMKAD